MDTDPEAGYSELSQNNPGTECTLFVLFSWIRCASLVCHIYTRFSEVCLF